MAGKLLCSLCHFWLHSRQSLPLQHVSRRRLRRLRRLRRTLCSRLRAHFAQGTLLLRGPEVWSAILRFGIPDSSLANEAQLLCEDRIREFVADANAFGPSGRTRACIAHHPRLHLAQQARRIRS